MPEISQSSANIELTDAQLEALDWFAFGLNEEGYAKFLDWICEQLTDAFRDGQASCLAANQELKEEMR